MALANFRTVKSFVSLIRSCTENLDIENGGYCLDDFSLSVGKILSVRMGRKF